MTRQIKKFKIEDIKYTSPPSQFLLGDLTYHPRNPEILNFVCHDPTCGFQQPKEHAYYLAMAEGDQSTDPEPKIPQSQAPEQPSAL